MVKKIRAEYDDDALAEEFIEGREVYVGVIGETAKPKALPVVELDFGKRWKKGQPRIANREVKFGPEREGSPRLVIAKDIPEEMRFRIERSALLAFRVLKLHDYARIDFRISEKTGEAYVLEANPNPYLEKESELALAAEEKGVSYTQLIGRIVESAAARSKIPRKAPPEPEPQKPKPSSDAADESAPAENERGTSRARTAT